MGTYHLPQLLVRDDDNIWGVTDGSSSTPNVGEDHFCHQNAPRVQVKYLTEPAVNRESGKAQRGSPNGELQGATWSPCRRREPKRHTQTHTHIHAYTKRDMCTHTFMHTKILRYTGAHTHSHMHTQEHTLVYTCRDPTHSCSPSVGRSARDR